MIEKKLHNSPLESGHCACSRRINRPVEKISRPSGKKAKRGVIGRWLDRLAKVNEREFGSGGPCCH